MFVASREHADAIRASGVKAALFVMAVEARAQVAGFSNVEESMQSAAVLLWCSFCDNVYGAYGVEQCVAGIGGEFIGAARRPFDIYISEYCHFWPPCVQGGECKAKCQEPGSVESVHAVENSGRAAVARRDVTADPDALNARARKGFDGLGLGWAPR